MSYVCIIARSHRRHGQDETVLSCPCRQCEHSWRQDKTCVLSRPSFQFPRFQYPPCIWDWTVANWKLGRDKRKLSCLVANSVHTADTDTTRQDSFVLSVSAVWTSYIRWQWRHLLLLSNAILEVNGISDFSVVCSCCSIRECLMSVCTVWFWFYFLLFYFLFFYF